VVLVWCPSLLHEIRVNPLSEKSRLRLPHVHLIPYASQSKDELGRILRKQSKINRLLGEYWQRLKGMQPSMRERLVATTTDCEGKREAGLVNFMEQYSWLELGILRAQGDYFSRPSARASLACNERIHLLNTESCWALSGCVCRQ
jgi:hypothetical protein